MKNNYREKAEVVRTSCGTKSLLVFRITKHSPKQGKHTCIVIPTSKNKVLDTQVAIQSIRVEDPLAFEGPTFIVASEQIKPNWTSMLLVSVTQGHSFELDTQDRMVGFRLLVARALRLLTEEV